MKRKVVVGALTLVGFLAAGVWYYVFVYSKTHHRNVADEQGLIVPAGQIVKDYETDEAGANKKYLNKAVEIEGFILKKDKDQAGNTTITLKSGDPMANIFCTLKPGEASKLHGNQMLIKGICTGYLSDVVLNEAVVLKSE